MNLSSTRLSESLENGLVTKSSMPASNASSRAPAIAWAVRATIGVLAAR
jgi:hypothetical protein